MLFLEGNAESKDASGIKGTTEIYQAQGALEQLTESWDALGTFVIPKSKEEAKKFVDVINRSVIAQESLTKSLQRSMGGVITGADEFAKKFKNTYYDGVTKVINGVNVIQPSLIEIGATFKDTVESAEGLASSMGRMVNPSEMTVYNMVELAKATGESSKAIGTMVGEMSRYGFTQLEATEKLHDLSVEARKAGLSAKGYMTEINKNMKSISGFGFKSGIDGMSKMVKQAMLLRTNIESIGAKNLQGSVLDPEGAIEMAANFQMLGGAVGKLSDPFQLMNMAQTDMEGLQNELVNSAKAATTFNNATGKFDVSTADMYRLREQAKLTGANLEDLVNTGKEAAKMDYIKDKFDLSGIKDENQQVLSGLSEIGAKGEVKFDLPGFNEQGQTLQQILGDANRKKELDKALAEYQVNANKSEQELAISQMTISEDQAKDINVIKEAILRNLSPTERKDLETSIKDLTNATGEKSLALANQGADVTKDIPESMNKVVETAVRNAPTMDADRIDALKTVLDQMKNEDMSPKLPVNDLFLGANNSGPKIMSKGSLYQGIVGDEVAMGTNLTDAFNRSGKLNEILSSIGSAQNTGGNTSVNGKIDININLTGAISGDKNADVEKMFSDPRVQKQIMDTVLYKLDSYKRQQGVLS
jgi:hypothetical protein